MNSNSIQTLPVRGTRMLNDFIRLAWTINASDPKWVPPLILDVKEFLDPKRHPFYTYGHAEKFVAYRDGKPVGRILVSDDPHLNEEKNSSVGAWGMFECINDQEVANSLLQTAENWSQKNWGRKSIVGPMDYSCNYPIGLLIKGFDTPPKYMMNHNPPYYENLILNAGYRQVKTLYAWMFDDNCNMREKWAKRIEWIANRTNVTVRPFDKKRFESDIAACRTVYNDAQTVHWNYATLTEEEFKYYTSKLVAYTRPEQVLLAFDDEKPVGFAITLDDFNEAIKYANGKLFWYGILPIGLIRFLWASRNIKTGRMLALCVNKDYRNRGVSETLIFKTLDYGRTLMKYTQAELGWTFADNEKVNRIIERVGGVPYKTYGMYEKIIDSSSDSTEKTDSQISEGKIAGN
ncbi:MAG: GNAT family N-acetyltransferase [Thermoguttaceae bacterium]|nr:GNAT family N-acetyltransferase [Thermoguttaceae bacterium]MBQ6615019.1 GNAT family N-acetyltransferase [Thermoguttaceae bacterium]